MGIGEQFEFERTGRIDPETKKEDVKVKDYCWSDFEAWCKANSILLTNGGGAFWECWKAAMDLKEKKMTEAAKVEIGEDTPQSSNILSTRHNGVDTLWVTFKGGSIWQYSGVPKEVYHQMVLGESIGSYFSKNIRGKYPEIKLDK